MSNDRRLVAEIASLRAQVERLQSLEMASKKSQIGSAVHAINTFLYTPGIRAVYPTFNVNALNIDGMNLTLNATTNDPTWTTDGFASYTTLDTTDDQYLSSTHANFNRENGVDGWADTPGVSIGAWIRLASLTSAVRGIIGQWNPFTTDKSYGLWMNADETISGSVSSDGSGNDIAQVTTKTLITNQWYFAVMVWVPSTSVKTFVYDPSVESLDTATNTTTIEATLHQLSPVDFTYGARYSTGGAIQGWDGDLAWGFYSVFALTDAWVDLLYQVTRGSLRQ